MRRTLSFARQKPLWILAVVLACGSESSRANEPATTGKSKPKPAARLLKVTLHPQQVVLAGARARQGLRLTAEYEGGRRRDVTRSASFRSAAPSIAVVDSSGVIRPKSDGSTTVSVEFEGKRVTARVKIVRSGDNHYNFCNDVLPVISKLGCNQMGCHGSPKGKKRLHLSLFSADPHYDYGQIADRKKKLIDLKNPAQSWLLLKAICDEDHGGGDVTEEGSPEYNVLLDWIKQGAPEGTASDPRLERIEVYPAGRRMLPGEKQHLLVEAYYSDGSMRDVTDLATFKSNEESVAKVDATGVVEGTGYGEAVLMVGYGGKLTSSRVISSQPLEIAFPELPQYNRIDELVDAKLKSLNIVPSEPCTDAEFLRRVYLDVIGLLPTPEEARAFLGDSSPDKRARLIDALLDRPEYADFYAVKWGDILQINRGIPARLENKGMWAYYRWLWDALDQNMPMDQFVHETLTATGSGYRNGPANFFRVGDGPQGMAEHASTVFLGVRLDCAHCHNHPFEQFTLVDNLGMAAFFARVRLKRSAEQDEEIIYLADSGSVRNPDTKQPAAMKFLGGAELAAKERARMRTAEAARTKAIRLAARTAAELKRLAAQTQAEQKQLRERLARAVAEQKRRDQVAAAASSGAQKLAADLSQFDKQLATRTEAGKKEGAKERLKRVKEVEAARAKATAAKDACGRARKECAALQKQLGELIKKHRVKLAAAKEAKRRADQAVAKATVELNAAKAAVAAVENEGDPRAKLADWITSPDNPYFARHMSNRVWAWLLGRGIIDEPDDFRSTNPASNPELLDYLAAEFIRSGYDLKGMFRLILNSRTYQASAVANKWNRHDHIQFSHYYLKRLTAEQLADAISQVTGVAEKYPGMPLGTRAAQLPDVAARSEFLDLFGRPKRATPIESERTCDTHIGQSLQMISLEYIARKLRDNSGRAARLAASGKPIGQVVDELYLATLSRFPTDAERRVILAGIDDKHRRERIEDLMWVLMNTKEFLFNH